LISFHFYKPNNKNNHKRIMKKRKKDLKVNHKNHKQLHLIDFSNTFKRRMFGNN
jgi:hypothetical protein